MADGTKYVPRVSFDISKELYSQIQTHIPWGSMRPLMTSMVESVIKFIESTGIENRNLIIGAIISGRLSVLDILKKNEENKS
jgi:uncharacterized protein YqgV (UPF0045/DUF77 family)